MLFKRVKNLEETVGNVPETSQKNEKVDVQKIQTTYVEESQVIDVVEKVRPSVVSVIATKDLPVYRRQNILLYDPRTHQFVRPDENNGETEKVQTSAGSGFIFSKDGYIMSNRHVVADENADYTVVLSDGTELPAEVIARDNLNDVAILKVKDQTALQNIEPLTFGTSEGLRIGQRVIAIGNALAEFQNTVTTGIVSGLGRSVVASGGMEAEKIQGLIQTDAAINPGNSGGPLVSLDGQVIGMNTAIASGAEGIGFAIPSDDLQFIATSVENTGRIVRPFLGVQYVMLTPENAAKFQVSSTEGAFLVTDDTQNKNPIIENSPAEKAGLLPGDIITTIDGEKLTLENDLRRVIQKKSPNSTLKLEILRNEKREEVEAVLAEVL